MRRFVQGQRFWEITVEGKRFSTRAGRLGSEGEGTSRGFDSEQEAAEAAEAMIALKKGKGFLEVVAGAEDSPRPAARDARAPELEAAIDADPDDERAFLVYGDWLQSQGDPRGELISIHHAMRVEKDPAKFSGWKREEKRVFDLHRDRLVGRLDEAPGVRRLDWRLGFIDRIELLETDETPADLAAPLGRVLEHPSGRFLRGIRLRAGRALEPALAELARRHPPVLQDLSLVRYYPPVRPPEGGPAIDLEPFLAVFPGLTSLWVEGFFRLGALHLARLESLRLRVNGPDDLAALAQAEWPRLQRLDVVHLGVAADLGFLARPFPALKHLGIHGIRDAGEVVNLLAAGPLLSRLKTLDLRGFTAVVVRPPLLAHSAAFRHLESIDLTGSPLSPDQVAELQAALPRVKATASARRRPLDAGEIEIGAPIDQDYRYDDAGE